MNAAAKDQACGNCRFVRDRQGTALCCRRSPLGHAFIVPSQNRLTGETTMGPQTIGYFPLVRLTDWCGEWERSPEAMDA